MRALCRNQVGEMRKGCMEKYLESQNFRSWWLIKYRDGERSEKGYSLDWRSKSLAEWLGEMAEGVTAGSYASGFPEDFCCLSWRQGLLVHLQIFSPTDIVSWVQVRSDWSDWWNKMRSWLSEALSYLLLVEDHCCMWHNLFPILLHLPLFRPGISGLLSPRLGRVSTVWDLVGQWDASPMPSCLQSWGKEYDVIFWVSGLNIMLHTKSCTLGVILPLGASQEAQQ